MRSPTFAFILFFGFMSGADQLKYTCVSVNHIRNQTLVAGKVFDLQTERDFATGSQAQVSSEYLGNCVGQVKENNHSSAEGWVSLIEVGGDQCAADGFDIYFNNGRMAEKKVDFIQIGVESDEASYTCLRVN